MQTQELFSPHPKLRGAPPSVLCLQKQAYSCGAKEEGAAGAATAQSGVLLWRSAQPTTDACFDFCSHITLNKKRWEEEPNEVSRL